MILSVSAFSLGSFLLRTSVIGLQPPTAPRAGGRPLRPVVAGTDEDGILDVFCVPEIVCHLWRFRLDVTRVNSCVFPGWEGFAGGGAAIAKLWEASKNSVCLYCKASRATGTASSHLGHFLVQAGCTCPLAAAATSGARPHGLKPRVIVCKAWAKRT